MLRSERNRLVGVLKVAARPVSTEPRPDSQGGRLLRDRFLCGNGHRFAGDLTGVDFAARAFTWDSVRRLRDIVKTKIVLKGILSRDDAKLAADNGIDAIILSNHGGRNDDNGRSTIDALPEIVESAGHMPVLIDSGFRRGTDIVKALALGATAVGIGRPYLWGLGAFGQPGVERVLEILRRETRAVMQQMGASTIRDLVPSMVRRA